MLISSGVDGCLNWWDVKIGIEAKFGCDDVNTINKAPISNLRPACRET